MEDDCEECSHDWKKHKTYHTDLWIGPDKVPTGAILLLPPPPPLSRFYSF